ncbi:MAG: hypothetical protein M3271_07170 [Actinomycetota bacterium]|nr:hypothetical protein [Actinomycetota bacterium]
MRAARLALIAALAASSLLVASPAHARHVCGLDDPTLNDACESHPENLLRQILCLISPIC